MSKVFSK